MKKNKVTLVFLAIIVSGLSFYWMCLPKYICGSFGPGFKGASDFYNLCVRGEYSPSDGIPESFFNKLKKMRNDELAKVFQYEENAKNIGYQKYRSLLIDDFYGEDGSLSAPVAKFTYDGRSLYLMPGGYHGSYLALILGNSGGYKYYSELGDKLIDRVAGRIALKTSKFFEYTDFSYVRTLGGLGFSRRNYWRNSRCCFVSLKNEVAIQSKDFDKSEEFVALKTGMKALSAGDASFFGVANEAKRGHRYFASDSAGLDYWLNSDPVSIHRHGSESILYVDVAGSIYPVYMKKNSDNKYIGYGVFNMGFLYELAMEKAVSFK